MHRLWSREMLGSETIEKIMDAYVYAVADTARACTHNKGIMNGIDAVLTATGNDVRAVEAGAHAWAARTGRINRSLRLLLMIRVI